MSTDPLTRSRVLVQSLRGALARELGVDVPLIETHISWVLLAGEHAYKIKKPVRLSFLDFGTLAARRHFCDEELRLNRRFAPRLYLRVLPISGDEHAPRLGGDGKPIEFALQMQRMRDDDLAGPRLARGALSRDDVERFARTLAAWHRTAPQAAADGTWGTPQRVAADIDHLLADWPDAADAAAVDGLRRWFAHQADDTAAQAAQRLAAGHVRECHGDLHVDNLAWHDGELIAFDCLEFDPALRWIDTASEVAFLAMDLQARRRADLAQAFVDAYLEASGDATALPLLRRYAVYRALVRARVARLRADAGAAADYLALAQRLARQWDPRLLVTHGLPGSGKTRVTGELLAAIGAIRWRSDVERRRLLGSGHYRAVDSEAVYARLRELARGSLRAGYPTIVDAACLRRAQRDALRALARELRVPCLLLHCEAPLPLLRQRVRERALRGGDASEADEAVLLQLAAQSEPLVPGEEGDVIDVDTRVQIDAQSLAARWAAAARG